MLGSLVSRPLAKKSSIIVLVSSLGTRLSMSAVEPDFSFCERGVAGVTRKSSGS